MTSTLNYVLEVTSGSVQFHDALGNEVSLKNLTRSQHVHHFLNALFALY